MLNRLKSLLAAGTAAAAIAFSAGAAQAGPYDGVTVNVMTFTGPQIAEPLQRRAPDFEKLTGAKVNVITVPFSDLYTKLLTDWSAGTNSIDAAVFAPQWMVDYIVGGFLEGAWLPTDGEPDFDDITAQIERFKSGVEEIH